MNDYTGMHIYILLHKVENNVFYCNESLFILPIYTVILAGKVQS